MKAKILSVVKDTIPQYSHVAQEDVPTLVIKTTVEFYTDEGTLYHTQEYAQRPEDIDQVNPRAYFDRQAQIMQAEIDGQKQNAQSEASSQLADSILETLK